MSDVAFDATEYTTLPVFTIRSLVTVGKTVLAAAPSGLSPVGLKAKRALAKALTAAEGALARRHRADHKPQEDVVALDIEADQSWGAMRLRLQGYAALPQPANPRVVRAREVLVLLFGAEGLAFLTLPYTEQLVAMTTILHRIAEDDLARDLEDLAGAEFLAQLRAVNPRYDAMVKEMLARDEQSESLLDHLRATTRALQWYVNVVTGNVDPGDAESVAACATALRAIRNYRQTAAARQSAASDAAEPPPASPKPVG